MGSDHAGYALKQAVAEHLREAGHQVEDLGTGTDRVSVDYPDYAAAVGRSVAAADVELGVCVCGTGIGVSIAANKVPGVRAALVHDVTTARLARAHNHANVLCLGGRTTGAVTALEALDAFLATNPMHARHDRRVEMIAELEAGAVGAAAIPGGGSDG